MNKSGPIIVIEDDVEDQEIFQMVFSEIEDLENEVIYFLDGNSALAYLTKSNEQPFLILSDINMPKLSGFELRDKVYNNKALRLKCIPYLFFTTSAAQSAVIDAYSKSIQGFFVKPAHHREIKKILKCNIDYWKYCHSPNMQYNR